MKKSHKVFLWTFSSLLIAVMPLVILKAYISISENFDARWLLIRYFYLFAAWFVVTVGVCAVLGSQYVRKK